MSGMKKVLIIGKEWTPKKCPLTTSFVQKEFAIKLARCHRPVYFTALSATDEEKEDAERNGVRLILPNPKLKKKIDDDVMLLLPNETFPHLKNYKPISVIFGHACENGTADAALAIKNNVFEDAVFIPFYYEIPEDMGLDPETLQDKVDEMMEYAEGAFAIVSVGTNIYNYNENMYRHLNDKKHLPYIPWVGDEFENFDVPQTTVDTSREVYSLHTLRDDQTLYSLGAAAIAMGKAAYFYKYDKFRPQWKIRGIPNNCCKECQNFLNEKADSSSLKINTYPPLSDKIKKDLKQCHLLAVFTTKDDPFGMVGLLGCAAGVPSLVSKQTGFASFIEEQFADINSIVCNIEHADTPEKASEKWEEHIMKTLKNYDRACNTEQKIRAKLHEAAEDGIIAKYRTNLLNLVSTLLEDDQIANSDQGHMDMVNIGTSETPVPLEGGKGDAEGTIDEGELNNGNNQNSHGASITHHIHSTHIGEVEILITFLRCTPAEEELREKAKAMLNEITAPEDLPHVQAHLDSLGPITIRLVKKKSLCVVLNCETSESVEKLWIDYRRGKLKSLFTDDIASGERLQRYGVSTVSFKVSLPRWQYRQAVAQLKYLKEGCEPREESSDFCPVCGKVVVMAGNNAALSESSQEEVDITEFVAVELESSISRSDQRKADLARMLGGDGTSIIEIAIPKEERSKEVSSIMLFKVQAPQQLSIFARERPEILGALGINRYLHLDICQLSRVRSEGALEKGHQYDANELGKLVEESAIVLRSTTSEMLARQRDEDLRERLFGILESPQASPYLHAVTMVYDDHEIRQAIERDYTAEKDRLHKTIDEITTLESNRRPSVDINIEEFSFKFDDTQQSYRDVLHKLPCHFTWKQDVDVNFRYEYLMPAADDMLKHHGDLAPVPIKALKGYLYVSKLRPKYKRDPRAALKWFDEALSDNQKELRKCDDNDGPMGDKLVLLADIAWVHFLFGEKGKARERLNEIANLFVAN
ncbi:uncharacterized protein [Ptychodera flava]|uniref:uncharacterized protein n=1 Tax=Ptychodera flava TaxID=63121 RepID=UPI00396A586F